MKTARNLTLGLLSGVAIIATGATFAQAQDKRPNVVMLMSDDVGWGDYGVYFGGAALGHPTPNIDRLAKEGALFTSWYGQASCTAGRASFMTGRIPVRTALSVVVVPGDPNGLDSDTPTIAEFYQKNGYQTYFSGKWHLGDVEKFYPINHGFDEMKQFGRRDNDAASDIDSHMGGRLAFLDLDDLSLKLVSRAELFHAFDLPYPTLPWIEKPCASKAGAASDDRRNSRNLRASGLAEAVSATG